MSPPRTALPEIIDGDIRLRREFALPDTTDVVLPGRASYLVTLRNLSEEQARAVLGAAKSSGVDLAVQR